MLLLVVTHFALLVVVLLAFSATTTTTTTTTTTNAFQVATTQRPSRRTTTTTTQLGYEPKWKKKETLADQAGGAPQDFKNIGLKGSIPVVFKQGNETKRTVAIPGQPLRDVATQAGQFIKYGCGKGECGTCEALVNGQWIRPCSVTVPAQLVDGQESYVVTVKEVKSKAKSSGKFYSFRSFIMGFYNNLIGMVGFVKYRRNAKQNWQERQEYEDLIAQKTLEKKRARQQQQQVAAAEQASLKENK